MQMTIHVASPEAQKRMPTAFDVTKADLTPLPAEENDRSIYPFKRMQVGHCFICPFESPTEATEVEKQFNRLRVKVSQSNAKLKPKTFTVVRHNDNKLFEVARIA